MNNQRFSTRLFSVKRTSAALAVVLLICAGFTGACSAGQTAGASVAADPAGATARARPTMGLVAGDLLRSVGRDAAKAQPEEGFVLILPDKVWAGEPFLFLAGGEGLRKVAVRWRGREMSAEAGKNNQADGSVALLLSTLQKETAGQRPIQVDLTWKNGKTETMKASVPVGVRDLPVQSLRVDPKFVTPPASVLEKIKRDRQEVRQALRTSASVKSWNLPLLRPVPGEITGLYGLRRVFNGQERAPHRGIDFDARTGDPVMACADGKVVLAADHYYSGKIVAVDHGLQVFSMYLHLSDFDVSVGQTVKRGDVVGRIGSTGRVTGPHLHFSLSVQGESVDAAPIMAGMEKITERATSGSEPIRKKAPAKGAAKKKTPAKKQRQK